jgi:hypothetical protein
VIRRSAVTVTVSALVSGLDAELQRLGYKDPTLVWYRGCWRRMERFFAARGVEEFSLDVAMAWVDESCGFFDPSSAVGRHTSAPFVRPEQGQE